VTALTITQEFGLYSQHLSKFVLLGLACKTV